MTVMPGKIPRPSGAWQIPSSTRWCAGTPLMSLPSNTMRPELSGTTPEIVLSVVVLPAPLAPIRVTTSPCATVHDTPLSASTLP